MKTKEKTFTANEIDGAYLLGVFNSSGLDGLKKEIERMKEIGFTPHELIEIIKKVDIKIK